MSKILCFIFDGNKIYLEQTLVEFDGVPIFFICKDEDSNYYIALCSDSEEFIYIVVAVSYWDLYDLLHSKITMREIITNQKYFWEVIAGEETELDQVTYQSMKYVDTSALPEEGAFYQVFTEEVEEYIEKFDQTYCLSDSQNKMFDQIKEKGDLMIEVYSDGPSTTNYENYWATNFKNVISHWANFDCDLIDTQFNLNTVGCIA